jgi:hypothetical protein
MRGRDIDCIINNWFAERRFDMGICRMRLGGNIVVFDALAQWKINISRTSPPFHIFTLTSDTIGHTILDFMFCGQSTMGIWTMFTAIAEVFDWRWIWGIIRWLRTLWRRHIGGWITGQASGKHMWSGKGIFMLAKIVFILDGWDDFTWGEEFRRIMFLPVVNGAIYADEKRVPAAILWHIINKSKHECVIGHAIGISIAQIVKELLHHI